MSGIPRYRMTNNFGHQDNDNGAWVRYEDHVAAMKAALLQPKFKVGDEVTIINPVHYCHGMNGKITSISSLSSGPVYHIVLLTVDGQEAKIHQKHLTHRVPPTPAELIPTLREHEWVRGTYKKTGIAFGPCTVYYNEIGAMFAGDNNLIHWDTGKILDTLATLERCDAPVVVK